MVDLSTCEAIVRNKNKSGGKYIDPENFYIARRRAGLSREAAAAMLDVTLKTVKNWEGALSPIPFAAFKVMRHYGGYLLAGEKWEDWTITPDKIYSPEGRGFEPHELRYISNYFMMARLFLKERENLKPNVKTSANPTAAREAASGVSPAPLASLAAPPSVTGTLTPCSAALLRRSTDSAPRLLVSREKTKGGEAVLPLFKFGTFESYRTAANQEQYAEVL